MLAADGIAVAAPAPHPDPSAPTCGIELPVRLSAVRLADGRLVPLEPAALMRCDMAAAVARWVREDVAPAAAKLGSPLAKVQVAADYQCRPRNRVVGAKMSEHGRGNAIDTGGYTLVDGRQLRIGGTGANAMPAGFQAQLRASACARFKTILGPGSDGYHEQHLHVDLAPRRSGAVLCQWTLPDLAGKQGPDERGVGAAR
ncbi:MAG TPA: extensin family protein [Xanthobacteraceae bacterium]|nr:extensin family protein [Xanthobacteraceae bacterium]